MKQLYVVCMALCHIPLFAQSEYADTTTVNELNEIVIEARMQRTSANSSVYSPSSRQKSAATDAVSLLSQMAIPQLDVNPSSLSVTTLSGQPVSIFIDYVAATPQDLSGMLPSDVRKVEVLLNPQDPRFNGAQHVVNFVMRRYEWGGYTKIAAAGSLGVSQTEGNLYSKFAFRKMTFDLYAGDAYKTTDRIGSESKESFLFPNLSESGTHTIERTATPVSSSFRRNTADVTLRALYSTEKAQVSNILAFNSTANPRNDSESRLTYNEGFLPQSTARKTSSADNLKLSYDFDSYFALHPKIALDVAAGYIFSHNTTDYVYEASDSHILNNASEHTHDISLSPRLVWNPERHISVSPFIHAQYLQAGIDYRGNSPSRQDYKIWGGLAGVRFSFSKGSWSAGTMFSWTYADTDLSGIVVRDNYPTGNVFCSFSPNDRHQFDVRYNYGKMIPETAQKSPNMLRQDELLWYAGTPGLQNFWNHRFAATYVWLPSNVWQVAADSYYFMENKRVVSVYAPYGEGVSILRRYLNRGNSENFMVGGSLTAKLSGGTVIARVHPQYWHRSVSGEYNTSVDELSCSAQLTWYFGNFHLLGWYTTPSTYIDAESGMRIHVPDSYQVRIGWRKGGWQLTATAFNFLRSSWKTSTRTLRSQYYGIEATEFGTDCHMRFQLSASYTFGYGRKVNRSDEVGATGTSESAILK